MRTPEWVSIAPKLFKMVMTTFIIAIYILINAAGLMVIVRKIAGVLSTSDSSTSLSSGFSPSFCRATADPFHVKYPI
jgi:hypothetical protein